MNSWEKPLVTGVELNCYQIEDPDKELLIQHTTDYLKQFDYDAD